MRQHVVFLLPIAVLLTILFAGAKGPQGGASAPAAHEGVVGVAADLARRDGRLVVVVIDSLRHAVLEQPSDMPNLRAFATRPDVRALAVETCAANFTYPCMQTLFEGRQSPYAAGLHNFSGAASNARNVPGDLSAAGRRVAILSDVTLVSLYGEGATKLVNVEDWPIAHLERDLRSLEIFEQWLGDPTIDDIFFHLIGTDKAAHQKLPGTDAYREHFATVDAALMRVLAGVDLSRDNLVITGDHGHGLDGHHNRESVAIFAGPRFARLFAQQEVSERLAQPELMYFMSWAAQIALPLQYEGRYFLLEHLRDARPAGDVSAGDSRADVQAFMAMNRAEFAAAGYKDGSLKEVIERHRQASSHERALLKNTPWYVGFFLWMLLFYGWLSGAVPAAGRLGLHAALAVSLLVSGVLTGIGWGVSLGLGAGYLAAIVWWVRRHGQWRAGAWLLALSALSASIAFITKPWTEFFHTNGFSPAQPIFYAMLPAVGALLALARDGDWRRAPEGALAFGIFCIPSGVYYYQFGQNIFWGFLLSGALVGLVGWALARRRSGAQTAVRWSRGRVLTAGVLAVSAVLLLVQEAGAWDWEYYPAKWLKSAPVAVELGVFALAGAYVCALVDGWRRRLALGAYLVAACLAAVWMGEMALEVFVSAQVVLVFMASYFALQFAGAPSEVAQSDAEPLGAATSLRHGLVLWAGLVGMAWYTTWGFFIPKLDFHFAFQYFGDLQREQMTFLAIALVTLIKYGLPICSVALAYRLLAGARAWRRTRGWVLFFAFVHLFTLFLQVQFAALGSTEKLYELAISEIIFILGLLVMTLAFTALQALSGRVARIVRRAT